MTLRCYAAPEQWADNRILLDAGESHHLLHVLRLHTGQPVTVLDGQGHQAETVILSADKHGAELEIADVETHPVPQPAVTLAPALIKHQRMDWLIQKSVELGATGIHIVQTQHSIARIRKEQLDRKQQRFRQIACSALKQSGRHWLPEIQVYDCLNTLFESIHSSDLTLICTLNAPEIQPLKSILADQKEQEIKTVCALIGPEGDFTEEEVHLAIQHGAFPALLGEHVLRAETAACYILSILSYALE